MYYNFFNKRNSQAVVQAADYLFLTYSAYRLLSDPTILWEEGTEIALLALNAFCLRENGNNLTRIFNAGMNFSSLGFVYGAVASGSTSRPMVVNLVGVALHFTNIGASLMFENEASHKDTISPS